MSVQLMLSLQHMISVHPIINVHCLVSVHSMLSVHHTISVYPLNLKNYLCTVFNQCHLLENSLNNCKFISY